MESVTMFRKAKTFIGHKLAIACINQAYQLVQHQENCKVIYIEARGGLGKTFLLQNIHNLINGTPSPPNCAALIDFYDSNIRAGSAIEQALLSALVAGEDGVSRFTPAEVEAAFTPYIETFTTYEQERRLLSTREREEQAAILRKQFVAGFNHLSTLHPIVLSFDTTEALVTYPSQSPAISAEIKTSFVLVADWFTQVLPQLKRTLVIFCGRPVNPPSRLYDELKKFDELNGQERLIFRLIYLEGFTREEIGQYLAVNGGPKLMERIDLAFRATLGRPLLLAAWHEIYSDARSLPGNIAFGSSHAFVKYLLENVFNIYALSEASQLSLKALTYCLYILTYARRGITHDELLTLLKQHQWPINYHELSPQSQHQIDAVVENLPKVALVKYRRGRFYLHDEIFELIDHSGLARMAMPDSELLDFLIAGTEQRLTEASSRSSNSHSRNDRIEALNDLIYYKLSQDIALGYREYTVRMYQLFNEQDSDHALLLRDEFLSWMYYTIHEIDEEGNIIQIHPNLERIIYSDLQVEEIERDAATWLVKYFHSRGQNEEAIRIGRQLLNQYGEVIANNTDEYFAFDLLLTLARTLTVWRDETLPEALDLIDQAINVLTLGAPNQQFMRERLDFFYGEAYNVAGYARRRQTDFDGAASFYRRALQAYSKYRRQPKIDMNVTEARVQTLVNYTFVALQQGNLILARMLDQELRNDPRFPSFTPDRQAVVFNVLSMVLLASGDLDNALQATKQAEQVSKTLRSRSVYGQVAAQIARVYSERVRQSDKTDKHVDDLVDMTDAYFEKAFEAFREADEATSLRETLLDHGKFRLHLGRLYRRRGQQVQANQAFTSALTSFDAALEALQREKPSLQLAEVLTNQAIVHRTMDNSGQAEQILDEVDSMMPKLPPIPYAQIVAADLSLTRAQIAMHRGQWEKGIYHCEVALTRSACFSTEGAAVRLFRKRVEDIFSSLALSATREVYPLLTALPSTPQVEVELLPYQAPPLDRWQPAWQQAVSFLKSIGEAMAIRGDLSSGETP